MKILLIILLSCLPVSALTQAELVTDVRSLITDGQGTRERFTDSELTNWINEGQRIADVKSLCLYKATEIALVSGTTYYSLPSDFLSIRRVTRDYLSIQEMTPAGLDGRSAEWENQSGLPTYYFINFSTRTKIGFAPFPDSASDLATIRVEYMAYSPELTTTVTTGVPFAGITELYPYHYALSYYSAYKASMIDERMDKAKVFLDSYSALVDLMKDKCISRPNYNPSMIGKQ